MKIKGVISDMDGVILDSEKLYVRFWCEAGQFYGFPFERKHALGIRSMARPFAIERLQGWFGDSFDYDTVRNKRIELMNAYVEKHGIEAKPDAEKLLSYLKEKGIAVALATATPKDRAEEYLRRVGLLQYFDEVVSARMVKNGKPAPDIYLFAAEKLGLKPEECMALEDSQNGIRSANAAGCKTVMVPDLDGPTGEIMPLLYDVADGLWDVVRILNRCASGAFFADYTSVR
ncbi:MAG: HAD family phosphatase [Ruminococcus sp.]|nr:HAD family phosphatase [Ruminococcus sp.]